jgi:hypothetical protein
MHAVVNIKHTVFVFSFTARSTRFVCLNNDTPYRGLAVEEYRVLRRRCLCCDIKGYHQFVTESSAGTRGRNVISLDALNHVGVRGGIGGKVPFILNPDTRWR